MLITDNTNTGIKYQMKSSCTFTLILAVGAMLAGGTSLRADDTNSPGNLSAPPLTLGAETAAADQNPPPHQHGLYRAGELSVDAFGTAALGRYSIDHWSNSRIRNDSKLGAGLGLNYFFCRHLGIGADVYSENTTRAFVDSAEANLILRLPLGHCGFAPYIFAGGGHQFDMVKASFGQAGAGVEYRFTRQVGVFLDARGVVPDETRGYGVARLGARFAF
jgi:hypothetical protein